MKTRCGETDNPSYLAFADEPSRLLIDRLAPEVLCNPSHETFRSILRNVFPYELDPRGDILRDWLLAHTRFPVARAFNMTSGCLLIGRITKIASMSDLTMRASTELRGSPSW